MWLLRGSCTTWEILYKDSKRSAFINIQRAANFCFDRATAWDSEEAQEAALCDSVLGVRGTRTGHWSACLFGNTQGKMKESRFAENEKVWVLGCDLLVIMQGKGREPHRQMRVWSCLLGRERKNKPLKGWVRQGTGGINLCSRPGPSTHSLPPAVMLNATMWFCKT